MIFLNGRLEHKLRNEKNIDKLLSELPECVSNYYYSRSSAKESKGSEEYIRKIRSFFKYISNDIKNIDVAQITEKDVASYLCSIEKTIGHDGVKRETSFSYRKQVYSILNSFFEYLRKRKVISENPMDCIERPSSVDNVERIELDEWDLNAIMNAVDSGAGTSHQRNRQVNWKERDKAILLLLMNTGMRETALTEINLEDIDFFNNTIKVIDKRHKTHVYYINTVLKNSLGVWIAKRNQIDNISTDALFISNRRTRITENAVVSIVKKYSKEGLGFEISPHKLRAAFCTILYNNTHDIEKVRDAVGHCSVGTTQRYIVKDNSAKEESANIMNNIFER